MTKLEALTVIIARKTLTFLILKKRCCSVYSATSTLLELDSYNRYLYYYVPDFNLSGPPLPTMSPLSVSCSLQLYTTCCISLSSYT
jgi:hypothetical protein